MPDPADVAQVRDVLEQSSTIAVLGAHPDDLRPAHYVPAYLLAQGYRVLPVNPVYEGEVLFGETVCARLDQLEEPVDVVDVFRRSPAVADHVDEILGMAPLPRVVWLQLGIRNDEVAARLREAGIRVVQDRCTLADHRVLRLPPR